MAEQRCSGSQSCVNHCKTWTFLDTISFHNYNKKRQRKAHLLVALYLGLCLTIAHLTRYCSPGIDDAVSRSVGYKMRRGSSQCPKGQMLNGMNIVAGEPPPPTVWVCLFVCNFLCSNLYKFARKNTFVCKSSLSMWEWWVVISCWLIYCIYFLKFACQRWVLETLETFCRRYALTSENLHRKPTEAPTRMESVEVGLQPYFHRPINLVACCLQDEASKAAKAQSFLSFLAENRWIFVWRWMGMSEDFFWLLFNKYTQHHNKNWIAYNRFHFWIAIHQRGFYFFILA